MRLLGFQPDLDATVPGVLTECTNLVPYQNGFGPPPQLFDAGLGSLGADCLGGAWVRKLDDSSRVFAGTTAALFEAGSSWSDVSKVGGYNGNAETRWRFAQYGNYSIATNRVDAVQVSESGAFADLAGTPPKATIVETVAGFVMLFDYNDGVNEYPDGWWCSALNNHASWSASIATQAANGRLLDTPGPIRAGKRLGKEIVAYKERSMYMGFYDGPPVIWRWQLVPGEVGAVSQEAVVEATVNDVPVHIFAGFNDFYIFDGSRPVSIGKGIRDWWDANVPARFRYRTRALHDRGNSTVYFIYPESDGTLRYALALNYRTMQWGRADLIGVQAVLEYVTQGVTYHSLGTLYSTYNDLPTNISYDSPFWTSSTPVPAYFYNTDTLVTMNRTPDSNTTSSFRCGFLGDEDRFRTITRIRPRMVSGIPSQGSCELHYGEIIDETSSTVVAYNNDKNKFDVMKESHWFSPEFSYSNNYRKTGFSMYFEEDGEE